MAREANTDDESSADDKFLRQILASRVREIRRSLKVPQHELAAQIGTKQAYIFLVEAAEANVTLKTLVRLAKALKVDPRDLLRPEPLHEVDNIRSRELDDLVQSSILNLSNTIGSLSKNVHDMVEIKKILEKLHDLLAEIDQSAHDSNHNTSEALVNKKE